MSKAFYSVKRKMLVAKRRDTCSATADTEKNFLEESRVGNSVKPKISSLCGAESDFPVIRSTPTEIIDEFDDVYFNAVLVTRDNKKFWERLAEDIKRTTDRTEGVEGFLPALKYFNYHSTEVWVTYISDKEQEYDLRYFNSSSIEMLMTVTTSSSSLFTSHIGVSRSPFYEGIKHANASIYLHSFSAHFIKNTYPEKLYIITTPIEIMRKIFLNEFHKRDLDTQIYIDGHFAYRECPDYHKIILSPSIEEAEAILAKNKEILEETKATNLRLVITEANLVLASGMVDYLKNAALRTEKGCPSPITITGWPAPLELTDDAASKFDDPRHKFSFIINDVSGRPINEISRLAREDGEYKWFFGHEHQGLNLSHPMVVINADSLCSIGEFPELDYYFS